jgi:hypothetical protein
MTTRTFSITLDDADRLAVLTALGFAEHITPLRLRRPINELIDRLSTANGQDVPHEKNAACGRLDAQGKRCPICHPEDWASSGTDAARAVLASSSPSPNAEIQRGVTPHDYFAVDRKGNIPQQAPSGAELQTVSVVSAQERPDNKGKHLQVIFAGSPRAAGSGKANCFDPQLWPLIKKAQGHDAQLWIAESGNYLNIVGVRA